MNNNERRLKPFLKWAGGKRWFTINYSHLIPAGFKRYIEPFLGSGAVFFHVRPKEALLGDANRDLIEAYIAVRDDWKSVVRYLQTHHRNHSPEYYYKVRAKVPEDRAERAARFIYLNRTCWNGLYRVNRKGEFNVPIGTKKDVLYEDDDFAAISRLLKRAKLLCCDFEHLINQAHKDDLVFVDPPYTVRHNHNAFIKYNENLFSWRDQERLFESLVRARDRGARILATNAFHASVKAMYEGEFDLLRVTRMSPISSKADSRSHYEELVIMG